MVEFDGGGTVGSSMPMEVNSQCDRVVLRRLIARPRPRRTTLGFGICQMILGLAIIAVSFTAFALSTSNRVRNACPYWAGFSVSFLKKCMFCRRILIQGRRQGKSLEGRSSLGGPGGSAPWRESRGWNPWLGSGGEAPWSWHLFSAKIVIEALLEHVFPY